MVTYRGEQGTSGRAGGAWRDENRLRGNAWHVTVNTPTTVSAEQVAEWQATQRSFVNGVPVYSGYNTIFDSDSTVYFWPDHKAPNGARGSDQFGSYNKTLIHLSFACMPDTWEKYLNWSRLAYIQGAKERKRILDKFGWPLQLLTKAELARGLKGDITHHRLDPSRRYDPGAKQDNKGQFDFEVLYGLVEGDTPPPAIVIPERQKMFGYLKQGDEGYDVAQLIHLLNRFLVLTGGLPVDPRIGDKDRTSNGKLLQITNVYTSAVAAAYQHAIWRLEGWVLGHQIYAGEEGGSRVTVQSLNWLTKITHDLSVGMVDKNPSSNLTQSGIDLRDAQAAAEWVRANVKEVK